MSTSNFIGLKTSYQQLFVICWVVCVHRSSLSFFVVSHFSRRETVELLVKKILLLSIVPQLIVITAGNPAAVTLTILLSAKRYGSQYEAF